MLDGEQILDSISANELSVVPRPIMENARKRGGASIDLHLGRWFKTFKQTKQSAISLVKGLDESPVKGLAESLAKELDESPVKGLAESLVKELGEKNSDAPRTRDHFVRFGESFTIHPRRFILGTTLEWIKLPSNLAAQICGKSSLGRSGLIIETSSGVHPNFSGCLTLELGNIGEVPLKISPGMEICQLFFHSIREQTIENPGTFSGRRKPAILTPKSDGYFDLLKK